MTKDETLMRLEDLYLKAIDCMEEEVIRLEWDYIPKNQKPYWLLCKFVEVVHDFLKES